MKRVRFAPSPTGSLHVGNALSAVANRSFGDWLLLRIDDTDPARNVPGGEDELLRDLEWLGLEWDEGPVRQSDRRERHLEAAAQLGERFEGTTLVREDGTPTYHPASVVDDVDFGITHVIRGNDHRPNEALHRSRRALRGHNPRPRGRHADLPPGERRGRRRLRDHARDPGKRPPAERGAPPISASASRAQPSSARTARRPTTRRASWTTSTSGSRT